MSRYTLVCSLFISNHLSPSYLNILFGNTSTLVNTSPLFAWVGKLVPKCALAATMFAESSTTAVLGVRTRCPFLVLLFEKYLVHHHRLHQQLVRLQIHLFQLTDIFQPSS